MDPLPLDTEPVPADEPSTFDALYRNHHRDVLRYAALMLRDSEQAADVASDVFSRAFDAWQAGRGPKGRALPWLHVIARRLIVDRWRRRRLISWLPLPYGCRIAAPDDGQRSEFWLWLDRLATALPDRQREVIFLRYRRDLTDAEIGLVMGLTESGVRSLAGRAIQSLRDHPELSR